MDWMKRFWAIEWEAIAGIIVAVVVAWEAQAQPDRSLPDLTVSMNTNPVSVPVGMAYEVQIIITNNLPPSRPSPLTDVPRADPSIPVPPVGGPEVPRVDRPTITEGGADVQEAGLEFTTTFPGHHRVAMQVQPSISVRCNPSAGPAGEPDPKKEICAIGPLNKGGRWTITMVFAAVSRPMPTPGGVVVYGAHIDYLNRIVERDEGNNKAQVSMNIESPPSVQFDVLSYNVYMRPTTLFRNGQKIRAGLLTGQLSDYDAIVFQEAFDDEARGLLILGLAGEYPYRTRILGADVGLEQDGGVIILSKWPIVREDQRVFPNCAGDDCRAQKGVVYALINKSGRCHHVFGTHAQAEDRHWELRNDQFRVIKDFITSQHIRSNEPVIIAGDMNVDRYDQVRFDEMLGTLTAKQPPLISTVPSRAGPIYTYDGPGNDLNDDEDMQRYFDYVLYSVEHLQPVNSVNRVLIKRSPAQWREYFWESSHWDLSDHYAVLGRFRFAPNPNLPCPSAGAFRALSITGPRAVAPNQPYRLNTVPQGGGPNWTYQWQPGGATTPHLDAVAGAEGSTQSWTVSVTDVVERKTLSLSATVRATSSQPPPRPPSCPRGRKCCEPEGDRCLLCVPQTALCP